MKLAHLKILSFLLIATNLQAQPKADIGIRYSGNSFNLFQLEFRKPLNDNYALRFSLTKGRIQIYESASSILFDSDSLIVFRNSYQNINVPVDIRFGIERKLKWNLLSN